MEVNEEGKGIPNYAVKMSHEAKLKELLRHITSIELQLCSEASKEFMKLLRGEKGGEMLRLYVQSSSECTELNQAWNLRQSKPGLSYIMSLVSVILSHQDGVYRPNDPARLPVSRALDKFARLILEEKIGDVYKELNSKESKGKNAALSLMASIVRRGSGLAADVAKSFDFKLTSFLKLAEYDRRRRNVEKVKRKSFTRRPFVRFAMSFLEVGDPRLLRWVLQQKDMYSAVLRGLGSDEEETIVYVLSTLRERVLVPESMVPVGLRSVLFGSVTLEQLINISGGNNGGFATEIAEKVLFMVCTDPCNGLMPNPKALPNPLKGNPRRLLGVMKKLKATEIESHKDLLLAIVRGRPSFGSAYLDEFPYNLEENANWFAAVSLAANLISSVNAGLSFEFLDSQAQEPPSFDSSEVQSILKCISPRPFTRIVMNKGLLHSDSRVKHGTLRFILEALNLLDSLFCALNQRSDSKKIGCGWSSLKQDIQNEVQLLLPDHQVLLSLISSVNSRQKSEGHSLKRAADTEGFLEHASSSKKLKKGSSKEETDILVGGISCMETELISDKERTQEADTVNKSDNLNGHANIIMELWGLHESNNSEMAAEDEETYFYSKLLDTLKIYHRTMPSIVEGSFDFLKVLPSNVLSLPITLQQSLLSLLVEHTGWSSKHEIPIRCPPLMYKHLMQFINLVIKSSVRDIRDQAYVLAWEAMLSTGAFDSNAREIDAWFLFLPGFNSEFADDRELETIHNLSSVVVSFFCDVVSTIGNNLFKYWDLLRFQIHRLEGTKDVYPHFSPLVVCVLEKCLRLLGSESGTFSLPEKSLISLYVSNTLRYLLQTQVEDRLLSSLICVLLSEKLEEFDLSGDFCEWRPLKSLFCFSRSITDQQSRMFSSIERKRGVGDHSFVSLLGEVKNVMKNEPSSGITKAFSFSMLCAAPDLILQHFPEVLSISYNLCEAPFSILLSIVSLERNFLNDICKSWPEISLSALERVVALIHDEYKSKEMNDGCRIDSTTYASVAFSSFLKQAPFHVLFPAIISIEWSVLLESSKFLDLLLSKLSKEISDNLVSSFRLVLFWFHRIQSSYRCGTADEHVQPSEICFTLMNSMLTQLSGGNNYVQEIADTVFCHPAVIATLESPLSGNKEFNGSIFWQPLENFLHLEGEGIHKLDYHVLKVLGTFSTNLFAFGNEVKLSGEVDYADKRIAKVFRSLLQRLFMTLKDRFDQFMNSKDFMPLIPTLFALHNLIHCVSPLELLELVCWMFSRIDPNDLTMLESHKVVALSAGLNIAGCAFDLLSCYLQQPHVKEVPSYFRYTFERLYFQVVEIASRSELAAADLCLLKAVKVANAPNVLKTQSLPLCMFMSRIVASTPTELLSKCIQRTSLTKARLLFHLTQSSVLHLSVFGLLFMEIVHKSSVTNEDLIMLLPTALSYLNSTSMRYGQKYSNQLRRIPCLYWEILLDGFSNWKSYVYMDLFEVELGELVPLTIENLLDFIDNSLLGRAIAVMRHYLIFSGASVKPKKRFKFFDSVLPSGTDNLLDCDVCEIDAYSCNQSFNLITRTVTKIHLCKMLLFPPENMIQEVDGERKDSYSKVISNKENLRRVKFVNALVSTWQLIVKRVSPKSNGCPEVEASNRELFRLLEIFIFRTVMELTAEMHKNSVRESSSLTYPEDLARLCLLHRFEDPASLSMLRVFLTLVPEDKSLHVQILQLLLAHSQFAPTIQYASESSSSLQFGVIFRPMSSILRSLTFPSKVHDGLVKVNNLQLSELHMKQLEILKLLRVLHHRRVQLNVSEQDLGINSKELLFLLLSSYGATVNKMDLEIYDLMHELENTDKSNSGFIADMDYLWGSAAMRVRKIRDTEHAFSSNSTDDDEAVEEFRRSQFRENLPIDPRVCAATVLYFPYDRNTSSRALFPSRELLHDNAGHMHEEQPPNVERIQIYDPAFILRMSIHGLSMGYIEPVEYASLGLLAVTFVSLSSPDDVIRKLAYKALARFSNGLEINQKKRDVSRLNPLMIYARNLLAEQWQRIPSIHALFIAEASVLLLDPSNDHYKAISKLIKNSLVNTKSIPFFDEFFWSSSVTFKLDRIWMLRLLYSGLNLDDDAQIYVRNSVIEKLLNFYCSPFSDNESRELILQIVKKSLKFDKTTRYMVERCGVISWLSSLVSNFHGGTYQDPSGVRLTQLELVLEVVNDVISSRSTIQWLQQHALEQLSQLSCHLYTLLAGGLELVKGKSHLIISVLEVLAATLEISQKREVFQPHFTLSVEGLFQLYQAIDVCCKGEDNRSAEFGLKVVLMSTPQASIFSMDEEKLQKFVIWAASTALQTKTTIPLPSEVVDYNLESCLEKEQPKDSLASKLLRWLTASVIFGRLSWQHGNVESKDHLGNPFPKTLQFLLEGNGSVHRINQTGSGSEELLASTIYYLQQNLGWKCEVLTSVVTSLCLLLLPNSFHKGSNVLPDRDTIESLLSRIRCPAEANPSWRWSFDRPWKDHSSENSSMDELQACQSLLVIISNLLGKKSLPQSLSYQDVESSGVFRWERSLLETE